MPSGALYAIIEASTGEIVQEARQTIAAGQIPKEAAHALKLTTGVTAIKIVRRYYDASGGVMMASLN